MLIYVRTYNIMNNNEGLRSVPVHTALCVQVCMYVVLYAADRDLHTGSRLPASSDCSIVLCV